MRVSFTVKVSQCQGKYKWLFYLATVSVRQLRLLNSTTSLFYLSTSFIYQSGYGTDSRN